ncbi:ureidoglycolate lyase [Microdochium nivale]|nr:ureidoglycolate lyase [Microdochium nivale]
MIIQSIPIPGPRTITVSALTREAFAPFGTAIANPRPAYRPQNTSPQDIASYALPFGAVSANQGSAIQYRALAPVQNLYRDADYSDNWINDGTGQLVHATASPRMTMFVCATRGELEVGSDSSGNSSTWIPVRVLERHPFTSQTFIPLTADASKRYLVIVAPTSEHAMPASNPPAPTVSAAAEEGEDPAAAFRLPGPGLPDLDRLVAFIATGEQAVTYGAGTWHAPMVALGPADTTVDFVVVQFACDVPIYDCQEVELTVTGGGEPDIKANEDEKGIVVQVPQTKKAALAKL